MRSWDVHDGIDSFTRRDTRKLASLGLPTHRQGVKATPDMVRRHLSEAQGERMRETRVQSLGGENLLEKAMATLSSILAWKIPWTEEPGRLQSIGSQRVGHDWATSLTHFTPRPRQTWWQDTCLKPKERSQRCWLCQQLDLGLWVSRTMRKQKPTVEGPHSVAFCHDSPS